MSGGDILALVADSGLAIHKWNGSSWAKKSFSPGGSIYYDGVSFNSDGSKLIFSDSV